MTGPFQVFGCRVRYITAGQAGKCVGQASFILPIHGMLVMQSVSIKGESACGMYHLDFQL